MDFQVTPNLQPLVPYIDEFVKNNNRVVRPPHTLDDIRNGFKVLFQKALSGDAAALFITEYMRANLTDSGMAARKSSARDFEDLFALYFNGIVLDSNRKAKVDKTLPAQIAKNKASKPDVEFTTGLQVSLKTFITSNEEINLGAFSKEFLFDGFLPSIKAERSQFGSKSKMLAAFQTIFNDGKWNEFVNRFAYMVEEIFRDDMVLIRKGNDNIDMYFLPYENLHFILIESMKMGPEKAVEIINRFESNSLRVNRDHLLSPQFAEKLCFNFGYTQGFKIKNYSDVLEEIKFKMIMNTVTPEDLEKLQDAAPIFTPQVYSSVLHSSNFDKELVRKYSLGQLDIHINFGYQG